MEQPIHDNGFLELGKVLLEYVKYLLLQTYMTALGFHFFTRKLVMMH